MSRIEVLKTYKLYIGGSFPRTESGRYYKPENKKGEVLGNICLASRKDFRNAVVAARKAQSAWAGRSAYNIGQIIYRIAENLESRKNDFAALLQKEEGLSTKKAVEKVEAGIDRLVYFAGWTDKYQQLFSNVNPVASSHFNFSMIEPTGVVAAICDEGGFDGLLSSIVATITSGNSLVVLADENAPLSAITFAEVLHHSDVPGGVVNILTGKSEELYKHFASHMDVNALLYIGSNEAMRKEAELQSAENLKRFRSYTLDKLKSENFENPFVIKDFTEVKTTWHPIEQIGGSAPAY
jgi:acyl-CoA reductase-like NAD-dependent aldehyde dehydrogenase